MGLNEIISFELAKLLVENNFYQPTIPYYVKGVLWNNQIGKLGSHSDCSSNPSSLVDYKDVIAAPTIAHVIDWILEKYGIWITVECNYCGELWYSKFQVASQENWDNLDKRHETISGFQKFHNEHNLPSKAYEAAINYCLTNLLNQN